MRRKRFNSAKSAAQREHAAPHLDERLARRVRVERAHARLPPEVGTVAHSVEWTPPARRDIARLLPKVTLTVITYVNHRRLAENPQRLTKPVSGELPHLRSARNRDYRTPFRLDDQLAALWIIRVDHHAHAYRAR